MSEELVVQQQSGSLADVLQSASKGKYTNQASLAVVTKVSDYLPYVRLYGGSSDEVKRGNFPVGHFGVTKGKTTIDLGTSFICALLAWRPKAMYFKPKPLAFFDAQSKEFADIISKADVKNANCGFGPELLMYLPEVNEFATYFLGNKTGRNESGSMIALIENGTNKAVIESHLIESSEYVWHGPRTKSYDLDIVILDLARAKEELDKFNNPPASAEEVAEEASDDARR